MSDTIIKVENLSKRYRIGLQEKRADTFAQQLWNNLKAPVENFRRIQSLGKFEAEEESVHWALKDVSFEVKQGEVLGIIGKNGAGKSTLLKILSKITEPTSGRIEMHGRVAALLEVGTGFHPELTGRENIYMNGTILGMTKKEIDRKLDEIIDFSGVEKYIDTPVKYYSSGMRVRLGFSVAAHLEPEILIIDEVLAVGDYEFQQKCLGKMEDVSQKEGRTVLFVSHNMAMMKNLCKSGLLLEKGYIEFQGNINETIDNYIREIESEKKFNELITSQEGKEIYIEFVNFSGEFITGGKIDLLFGVFNKLKGKNVEFSVSFSTLDGTPALQYYSGHMGEIFKLSKGKNQIKVRIEKLPLVNGIYYINLWLGSKGMSYDFHRKYKRIEVKAGRIIDNGPICTFNNYPVINPAIWEKNDG
ncbi:ABC transporter ATP-binding protein [Algoriphagus sp. CAU 1675]|uniref:ABC transporter ATP-binding protein n=1 Tax=Algoriphagus sp. CAU 1675 TaxID=3032597 RepID=UPI0023DBCF1B|nr:ABC transporter ATP-binding protein [Algoriphagus sp. CAU 1675]MDF2159408.1 ABC transporter ATP-binding protein [Algoriphagus sp. CAU 1675]